MGLFRTEWIFWRDKLPNPNQRVLVGYLWSGGIYTKGIGHYEETKYYHPNEPYPVFKDRDGKIIDGCVHWMPCPDEVFVLMNWIKRLKQKFKR